MYRAYRNCPKCNLQIEHTTIQSQEKADKLASRSSQAAKLCRSCIATNINNRRWSDPVELERQSQRFLKNNPSKNKPAWNRGIPRDESTKQKIRESKKNNGGTSGELNPNYGKFKYHNTRSDYKQYLNRVRVLTERNRFLIKGYDETKRGKAGIPGMYQIDHIKSIIDCWYEKLSPEQAADVLNLRFIPWEENLKIREWKKKSKVKQYE